MSYCTIRDLRNSKREVWDNIENEGELVVLNNGRPRAIIFGVDNDNVDIMIKAVRQAKAIISFNSMRKKSADRGYLSDEEINNEITAARKENQ